MNNLNYVALCIVGFFALCLIGNLYAGAAIGIKPDPIKPPPICLSCHSDSTPIRDILGAPNGTQAIMELAEGKKQLMIENGWMIYYQQAGNQSAVAKAQAASDSAASHLKKAWDYAQDTGSQPLIDTIEAWQSVQSTATTQLSIAHSVGKNGKILLNVKVQLTSAAKDTGNAVMNAIEIDRAMVSR